MSNNKLKKNEGSQGYFPSLFTRFFSDDFMDFIAENNMPAINVKEKKKYFKIEVSAPGFEKEDFDIRIDNNVLKITANNEKKIDHEDDDENVIRQEFISSSFSRSFVLPDNIDTENIEAEEKHGILTLKLPKIENVDENVVRRIDIK